MQYIAFLRGINVGGRTIKMAELKSCFEGVGFRNVQTVLQTGNVIFESAEYSEDDLSSQIESLLSNTFNYPAKILVLKPERLAQILDQNPLGALNGYHQYVVFTKNGFQTEIIAGCGSLDAETESVEAGSNVVYWRVKKGLTLDSVFGKYMAKAANQEFMTARNVNTLNKILAKTK